MSVRLAITETIEYEVEGESIYEAMRDFLGDPTKYMTGITEREVEIERPSPQPGLRWRALNETESAEIEAAERDS